MATVYSDGFTKVRAGRLIQSNETRGKVRTLNWDFASLPAGNIADVLVCGILPKGARVLQGREFHSAMGGSATGAYGVYAIDTDGLSLGTVVDDDKFLTATSFVAAGQTDIANTLALFAISEQAADYFVTVLNASSAFATAGRIAGWLNFILD